MRWIILSVITMVIILWACGIRAQQVTVYTGANGQYLGQAVVMSPTQPTPPSWGTNGR